VARIKALSIVAPGGSRIASGEKTLEVRRWRPNLGADEDLLIVENRCFLYRDGDIDPDGRAVAVVRISGVRAFTPNDIEAACASSYEDGWLAWEISHLRPIAKPFPAIAARKIYTLDVEDEFLREK